MHIYDWQKTCGEIERAVCHGVCVCVCVYLARARAVVLSLKKSKYHCISLHRRAKITEEGIETNVHIGNE